MKKLVEFLQFNTSDLGDLQDFVKYIFNKCLWLFVIATSIIVITAIFKAGNGGLPPEPQGWVNFQSAIGITW